MRFGAFNTRLRCSTWACTFSLGAEISALITMIRAEAQVADDGLKGAHDAAFDHRWRNGAAGRFVRKHTEGVWLQRPDGEAFRFKKVKWDRRAQYRRCWRRSAGGRYLPLSPPPGCCPGTRPHSEPPAKMQCHSCHSKAEMNAALQTGPSIQSGVMVPEADKD